MTDGGRLGAGKGARYDFFDNRGTLTGARFVVRRSAADAVTLGVAQLVAQGFLSREDNLNARLREQGSVWLAQAAEIGDAEASRTRGFFKSYIMDRIEETPLIFFNRFQRGIAPTLAMVAARQLTDTTTELVVYPHSSGRGDPEAWAGASARLRNSYEGIAATSAANGTLVSHESLNGIRNDGSPASQQMVRELLNWR